MTALEQINQSDDKLAALCDRLLADMVSRMTPEDRQRYRDALNAADKTVARTGNTADRQEGFADGLDEGRRIERHNAAVRAQVASPTVTPIELVDAAVNAWFAASPRAAMTADQQEHFRERMRAALIAVGWTATAAADAREAARQQRLIDELSKIVHNMVVADQAAWIEWRHGKGAEAAMQWIGNGLLGPGHIPAEDEPYSTEAQAWYDANRADAFPACHCGRPSNILHMGKGVCSMAHYPIAGPRHGKDGAA